MTDIEKKALALVNEVMAELGMSSHTVFHRNVNWANMALCRAIEQHEAFRQEVSDAVVKATHTMAAGKLLEASVILAAFIIAKPDPLVEVINDADDMVRKPDAPSYAEAIRAALAARGLEIREKQP